MIGRTVGRTAPWVLGLLIATAALVVSPGFLTIDELIYYHAARVVAETGSFVVENGYDTFAAPALQIRLLIPGPDGLVPQYPAGHAVAAAPLVALAGPRGLIWLNTAAVIGTLFLVKSLARTLYKDDELATRAVLVLALASFVTDYALGLWPHGIGLFCVTATLLCGVKAGLGPPQSCWRPALVAGLVAGAGLLLRLDSILIVPPLVLWAVLVAPRPATILTAAALGMAPAVALSAWFNHVKFGVFNPLTYGYSSGSVAVSGYIGLAIAGAAVFTLVVVLRVTSRRPGWKWPAWPWLAVASAAALTVALLIPASQAALVRLAHGAAALIVDIRLVDDPFPGIVREDDGTVSFWGLSKKALGQSLPWIGGLAFLALLRWRQEDRSRHLLCLLVIGMWCLPFAMRAWHGGLSANMRYLLPIVPVLSILVAWVWGELATRARPAGPLLVGVFAGLGGILAVLAMHPGSLAATQQVAATWLLGATALAGILAAPPGVWQGARARLAQGLIAAGLTFSFLFGVVLDPSIAQYRRAMSLDMNAAFAVIPDRSLVFGPPLAAFSFQLERPEGLLAEQRWPIRELDIELVTATLADGYRVYLAGEIMRDLALAADPGLAVVGTLSASNGYTIFEVSRPEPGDP